VFRRDFTGVNTPDSPLPATSVAAVLEPESHRERLSRYCGLLAASFGLDPGALRTAGWLHDVGMAAITLHAGGLGPGDRRALETHPGLGHALLAGAGDERLDTAAEVAWTHHERFDGAGYPRGLSRSEIPLAGRIAAVADTFDALTTDRAYRAAVSIEQAMATLRGERGHQLDPEVVDVLLSASGEALAIRSRFPPEPVAHHQDTVLTLQAAADRLSISPARLRRLGDAGRIDAIRTAGGHRRFRLADVLRLAAEVDGRPKVRPLEPPAGPLPALAGTLRLHGRALAAAAGSALYREGPAGWFASAMAAASLVAWLDTLADCCEAGTYERALSASEALLERAAESGATLLERHAFLERFGQLATRTLLRAGAEPAELAGTRRLVTSMQQGLLGG
jgi:excisionase family DNA binding protein